MDTYLSSDHFPDAPDQLSAELKTILQNDLSGSFYAMLGKYSRVLSDNFQRKQWPEIDKKLLTLFKCGKSVALDGPMIGTTMSIRDSDHFQHIVQHLGKERSQIASLEWMVTVWNMTFADTGLWMGKSFEQVTKDVVAKKCGNNKKVMDAYDSETTRIGRNFFRQPLGENLLQGISIPVLTKLWDLQDRPFSTSAEHFDGILTEANLEKEKNIPYNKTGSIYIADFGRSILPQMNNKEVYQLNYRWPALQPVYPMTCLVDEIVQIAEGIYLGQLIYATRHYSLGSLRLPFCPDLPEVPVGEPYNPGLKHAFDFFRRFFSLSDKNQDENAKYGYQHNGFFLMMDPAYARDVYADGAFSNLRPRQGEVGYTEIGYDKEQDQAEITPIAVQTQWKK